MSCKVIKELVAGDKDSFSAFKLVGCNRAEESRQSWITCAAIPYEGTDNVLDAFDLFGGKWGGLVRLYGLLHLGPVVDWRRLVRGMLRLLGIGMLVLGALSLDVPGDRQIDMLHVVVLIQRDATKQSAFTVHYNFALVFQRLL